MSYDFPFRLELSGFQTDGKPVYEIVTTDEGRVCAGSNFDLMRQLVNAANEAKANEDRHR